MEHNQRMEFADADEVRSAMWIPVKELLELGKGIAANLTILFCATITKGAYPFNITIEREKYNLRKPQAKSNTR